MNSARFARGIGFFVAALLSGCDAPGGDCGGVACLGEAVCRPGEASAQFQSQAAPPSLMRPWQHASASVSFANCSGQPWTRADFALRPARAADEKLWGAARVELPVDVPNGRSITIPIDLIAPPAAGTYAFSWTVAHDGVETFEEPSPPLMVQVLDPSDCSAPGPPARFRSQIGPAEFMAAGAPLRASVTFANCSTGVWRKDGALRLLSRGAPDDAWGLRSAALPFDVPPAHEVTIAIEGTAPTVPGSYTFAWQLSEGAQWLSEAAPTITSTVLDAYVCGVSPGPPARFISQRSPGRMLPDHAAAVSVRFGNCSGHPWGPGYVLDSALLDRARTWDAGPVPLPFSVGDGFAIDVPFKIRAPHQPGTHPYRFGVVTPDGTMLDETTPPLDVTVSCVPFCGDHNCGDDGCGGSCGGCPGGSACDGAHCQCARSCGDHNCGGDGCGGSCGNCGNNQSCDGAHCQAVGLSCAYLQWWNQGINYAYVNQYNWHDTDLNVGGSTPVELRHDSRLDRTGVYAWGYMPEFTDMVTGDRFKMLHLRPQHQNAVNVGHVYPAGFIVGLSGGDTLDTGKPVYSTGAHLCIQTLVAFRAAFPGGRDACR